MEELLGENKMKLPLIKKECANCKVDVYRGQWRKSVLSFCSRSCYAIYYNKKNKTNTDPIGGYKKCLVCAKVFAFSSRKIAHDINYRDFGRVRMQSARFCSAKCCIFYRNKYENPTKDPKIAAKISASKKGKDFPHLHTPEAVAKQRKTITGKGHWNWQGGKTPENKRLRVQAEAVAWRKAIFARDNYTCRECGARNGLGKSVRLEADHIKPWALYPELRYDLNNGRTLCKECHKKTDTYMGRIKRFNVNKSESFVEIKQSNINEPPVPITAEQALDPEESTRLAALAWSQGKQSAWSCWEKLQ